MKIDDFQNDKRLKESHTLRKTAKFPFRIHLTHTVNNLELSALNESEIKSIVILRE